MLSSVLFYCVIKAHFHFYFMEGRKINYRKLYELELAKNAQLEQRYKTVISEKTYAERKSLDIVNQYKNILFELEQIKAEYKQALDSVKAKEKECEELRRALLIIIDEIKKSRPQRYGIDLNF